ncbi:MAG: CPBP family intramembrane metalloprotease [Acidobacteria bacterium]|nr:MAG: CPBP family intramembrane metalloprotease [Acidobacteriota bacterium]
MDAKSLRQPPSEQKPGQSSASAGSAHGGIFRRPLKPVRPVQQLPAEVPNRYFLKEDEEGRFLSCLEAPEVKVRIDRSLSFSANAVRKATEGTIYLDGVAQMEPMLELERRVYNLDHHEGCVRPFTLAACEQALVLVLRGLDIREQPWEIYANEPDLDTVLAVWVLLNSMHLQEENAEVLRRTVIPVIRLEGLIDSHGLGFREFSGLPQDLLEDSFHKLEELRQEEKDLKQQNLWNDSDPLEYAVSRLVMMDQLVYPPWFFEAFRGIEELARGELTGNRIAVVCRSDCGIYELESDLKRLYGKRLGVIAQQKAPETYTLRQVDPFLPFNLEAAYRKLNAMDPAVDVGGSANKWGGSGEIGGSPRLTGTKLGPVDIAEALHLAYHRPDLRQRLAAAVQSFALASVTMLAGWIAAAWGTIEPLGAVQLLAHRWRGFLVLSLTASVLILLALARGRSRRLYGFQMPEGRDWLKLTPAVILAALLGGLWAWRSGSPPAAVTGEAMLAWVAFPLLAEIVFRGLAHGVLVRSFDSQHAGGRWFLSWPVVLSGTYYALWTLPLGLHLVSPLVRLSTPFSFLLLAFAALVGGLALGMVRERSGSLVASLGFHYLGLVAAMATLYLLL